MAVVHDDAFVVRFDATGAALDYATLLGGSGFEVAYGLALDANGCATVTGDTSSSDFPYHAGRLRHQLQRKQ